MEAVVHHDVFDSRDVITSKRSSNSFAEDFWCRERKVSLETISSSAKDSLVNMPPEDTLYLEIIDSVYKQ